MTKTSGSFLSCSVYALNMCFAVSTFSVELLSNVFVVVVVGSRLA